MESDDIDTLNDRTDVAILYMLSIFFASFCYGISCVVYILALANLWKRFHSSLAVKILFFLILTELLFDTVNNVSGMIAYTQQFLSYHLYSTTIPIKQQVGSQYAMSIAFIVESSVYYSVIPIANSVVIWRAWILYPSNMWVRVGLVISWICEFGICMVLVALDCLPVSDRLGTITNKLEGARGFLTLGVNLVTTLAIAWQAWRHDLLLQVSEMMRKSSTVLPVLYTLIEWGVLLCLAQLVSSILQEITTEGDPTSTRYIASNAIDTLVTFIIRIHPALIVLILAKNRSVIENDTMIAPNLQHHGPGAPPSMVGRISTMRFAQSIIPAANSDNENEYEGHDVAIRSEKRDHQVGLDIPSSG